MIKIDRDLSQFNKSLRHFVKNESVSSPFFIKMTGKSRTEISPVINPTPYEQEAELFYMHYSDGGRGEVLHTKPVSPKTLPFVMIAGLITVLDSWEELLQEIKKDFEIFYFESREKGTFVPPNRHNRKTFREDRYVDDLVEFLEAADLKDGKYILAGSSFGGTVIIDALAKHKIIPHSAILIGANTHFKIPFPGNILMKIVPAGLISFFKPFIRWYLRNFMVDREADERQYQKYTKAIELANFNYIKHTIINYHVHPQEDILQNILVPTIVVGAELDKMHTVEETKFTTDKIPNAEMKIFKTNNDVHSKPFAEYLLDKF